MQWSGYSQTQMMNPNRCRRERTHAVEARQQQVHLAVQPVQLVVDRFEHRAVGAWKVPAQPLP